MRHRQGGTMDGKKLDLLAGLILALWSTGGALADPPPRGEAEAARERCVDSARATREDDAAMCRDVRDARRATCELLGEDRYAPDPLKARAGAMIDPSSIPAVHAPNPYVSLAAGRTFVFRAGQNGEETGVVHVTGAVREIRGVACRVVADVAVELATDGGGAHYT